MFLFLHMEAILQAILPVFLLIGIGVLIKIVQQARSTRTQRLLKKIRHEDDQWSTVLNKFALYIALPALILHSLSNTARDDLASKETLLATIVLLVFFALIVLLIVRVIGLRKDVANSYFMCAFFGNVAYIGPPFILSLLPNVGGTISILIALHVGIAFTLGIYVLEVSKYGSCGAKCVAKNVITNPLILSVLTGLLILFFNVQLPVVLDRALAMLGSSASPVVLIAIGLFLAKKIRFDKALAHATIISTLKLVCLPLLFIVTYKLFHQTSPVDFTVSILEAGMPVALTNFALTEMYPMDRRIVAKAIIISTVLALLSLTALSSFAL